MAASSQLSSEEYERIVGQFAKNEHICVTVPDEANLQQFEVEYKIQGAVKQEDGAVAIHRGHKVSISIPFGYPKFSPNCKPLTPTFHPDFDQDAICTNQFWAESTTLPELIIYIGAMIAGQKFSKENTFNPEAAAWYQKNSEKLPFDNRDLQKIKVEAVEPIVTPDLSKENSETEQHDEAERYEKLAGQYEVDSAKAKKKKKLVLGIFMVVAVLFAGGYFVMTDLQSYDNSLQQWRNAATLVQNKQFQELATNSKEILARLERVRFINKHGRDLLALEIKALLDSEEVKAGLVGKILFEGRYLPKKRVEAIVSIRKLMKEGDVAFEGENWQDAARVYGKAKDLLQLDKKIEEKDVGSVDMSFARAELNRHFQEGEQFFAANNIDDAVTSFQKAVEIANNNKVGTERISQIYAALDKALLRKFVVEGEGAFTATELDMALESFNKALRLAEKESVAEPEYAERIRQSIVQVKLYTFLAQGKVAYESGAWSEALGAFSGALQFLSGSTLDPAEKQAKEVAIRKKILQTKIKGMEVVISRSKVKRDFSKAINLENALVKEINASDLKGESEFREKLEAARAEITSLRGIIDREAKIRYLTENYQKIFHDNHLLARSATLSSPYISFVDDNGDVQVFNLKCSGVTATGRISLELNYQYDRKKKIWRVGKLRH